MTEFDFKSFRLPGALTELSTDLVIPFWGDLGLSLKDKDGFVRVLRKLMWDIGGNGTIWGLSEENCRAFMRALLLHMIRAGEDILPFWERFYDLGDGRRDANGRTPFTETARFWESICDHWLCGHAPTNMGTADFQRFCLEYERRVAKPYQAMVDKCGMAEREWLDPAASHRSEWDQSQFELVWDDIGSSPATWLQGGTYKALLRSFARDSLGLFPPDMRERLNSEMVQTFYDDEISFRAENVVHVIGLDDIHALREAEWAELKEGFTSVIAGLAG